MYVLLFVVQGKHFSDNCKNAEKVEKRIQIVLRADVFFIIQVIFEHGFKDILYTEEFVDFLGYTRGTPGVLWPQFGKRCYRRLRLIF